MVMMAAQDADRCPKKKVLAYIDATLSSIISEAAKRPDGHPQIVLRRMTSLLDPGVSMGGILQARSTLVTYRWPGKNADEAWRFACVGRILCDIYAAIQAGTICTKRDIFYRAPDLFKIQGTVDRYIDDIAFTCGVTRRDLNVTASPKGLVSGLPGNDSLVISVPGDDFDMVQYDLSAASFNDFVQKYRANAVSERGIFVTGRGYPDLSTKRFLRVLVDNLPPNSPVLGLFDGDPDGLDIFRCYVVGSKALAQEHACSIPELQLVGIDVGEAILTCPENCMSLSPRDRVKARSMMCKAENNCVCGQRTRLQRMLMMNVKVEVQAVETRDWLARLRKESEAHTCLS